MNELRPFDPFAVDPFDDGFRALLRPWRLEPAASAPPIRIDVSERDDAYTVKAEIPGVRREDIDVRIDGNIVTISAEVATDSEQRDGERVLRRERQRGASRRSFSLECPLDEAHAEASHLDGVLTLTLPKKPGKSPRQLTIQ